MEPRMTVVKGQKPIHRQLRPEVVVLSTEHLLSHTGSNLSLEIKNRPKAQISTLSTLVILRMFDTCAATKSCNADIDILIQMQTLLCLRDATTGVHVQRVEESGMTIVKLSTDPSHRTRRQHPEHLLLSSGEVTQNTNILRKDIFTGANNSHRGLLKFLVAPLRIRTLA